jgi:hypothetical protein
VFHRKDMLKRLEVAIPPALALALLLLCLAQALDGITPQSNDS